MAGPTWRNEIDASIGLELSRISTAKYAKALRSPLLVQIADFDRFVPADAVARTAVQGRGTCTTTRAITSTSGPAMTGSTGRPPIRSHFCAGR